MQSFMVFRRHCIYIYLRVSLVILVFLFLKIEKLLVLNLISIEMHTLTY